MPRKLGRITLKIYERRLEPAKAVVRLKRPKSEDNFVFRAPDWWRRGLKKLRLTDGLHEFQRLAILVPLKCSFGVVAQCPNFILQPCQFLFPQDRSSIYILRHAALTFNLGVRCHCSSSVIPMYPFKFCFSRNVFISCYSFSVVLQLHSAYD